MFGKQLTFIDLWSLIYILKVYCAQPSTPDDHGMESARRGGESARKGRNLRGEVKSFKHRGRGGDGKRVRRDAEEFDPIFKDTR